MKKVYIPFIISFVVSIICLITVSLAWYTNTKQTKPIDSTAGGVVFSYTIDNSSNINEETYSIKNLTFFDIKEETELKFLPIMAYKIKIDVTNASDKAITFTSNYTSAHKEVKQNEDIISDAYVACIYSLKDSIIIPNGIKSISNLNDNDYSSNISFDLSKNGEAGDQKSFYIYVFGVQAIKGANNTSFINDEFKFSILFRGINK